MTSPEPAGETAFYEDPKPLLLFLALGTLMFGAGLMGLVLMIGAGLHDPLLWGLLAFFMLLGGGLLPVMAVRLRRRAIPYLVITPDGFRCPGLIEASVPWTHVDHAEVVGLYGNVFTTLCLTRHGRLPTRDGSRANVRVSKRSRAVHIGGPAPRDMDLGQYGASLAAAIDGVRRQR